uniref:transporter n=1 Tax=Flavobacterium sp. TaxID=239 RepID=UPI00404B4BE4
MKTNTITLFLILIFTSFSVSGQNDAPEQEVSNIQNYTPSKLLEKGKWDIKWFNNLYTQTKADVNGETVDVDRSNFFNTSLEIFTGASENKKFNIGFIIEMRSNTVGNQSATSVFSFKNEANQSVASVGHIAPSVKISPFNSIPRFSIQSSFFIPTFKNEVQDGVFLAQNSFIWQNRFFYDYTFPGDKFQLFSDLGTRLFLGDKEKGFANNSLEVAPGVFLSYFPSNKFTVLGFVQHAELIDLGNDFSQNYSALGTGAKYQLTKVLNAEILYSKFVRGNESGLGQSFNFGLRAIF